MTLFSGFISFGQNSKDKRNYLIQDLETSVIFNRSNEIKFKWCSLFLLSNKIHSGDNLKSGLFYGFGFSSILDKSNSKFYISSGLEYFNGKFEIDGKIYLPINNKTCTYFEPQVGVFLKKLSSSFLIGYNIIINQKSYYNEVEGVTFTYCFKIKY